MSQVSVSNSLQANYDNYYNEEDPNWRRIGSLDKVKNIVKLCSKYPHNSILEVGAGDGAILKQLSDIQFGNDLYGLEISKTGLDLIKSRNISNLRECSLFDGYQIDYQDNQFDIVVLSHVVEHVEYPRRLLNEVCRVAKLVFIEVPLEETISLPKDFVFDRVGHINTYSPRSIRRLLQSCNLEVSEQIVTCASHDVHTYHDGIKGLLKFAIKKSTLSIFPSVAPSIFTYNSALICSTSLNT